MRISKKERKILVESIETIDPAAEIYLFGSRTNNDTKGGDIDLLVISKTIDLTKKINILNLIFEKMEERRLDLVIKPDRDNAFVQLIEPNMIWLNGN